MLSDIELSDLLSFASQVFSAAMGLLGVILGAHIANRSVIKQRKLDSLRAAYAEVFAQYTNWLPFRDTPHLMPLVSAIYSARLLSSPEAGKKLDALADSVVRSNPDKDECSKSLKDFWECAQKEIRKGYGK